MNAIVLMLLLIISLPTLTFADAQQDEETARATTRLAPEQIQIIQTISRNVLAAKHSQQEDPDVQALRARVKELRQAIKDLEAESLEGGPEGVTLPVPELGIAPTVNEKDKKARAAKRREKRQAAQKNVRSALTAMRAQRVKISEKQAGAGRKLRLNVIPNALRKVEKLEKKLGALLGLQDTEQTEQLQELLDQTKVTKRRAVLPSTVDEKPALLRITPHRQ